MTNKDKVNMDVKIDGDKLVITVDLGRNVGRTKNGNTLIASTHGWMPLAPLTSFSMNVVRKG